MSRFSKFIHRHAKADLKFGKKAMAAGQKMNPMGGQQGGGMFGGMFGGGQQQQGGGQPITVNMSDPNADDTRSQAAQAMKRQAGGAQINFVGDGTTPASEVG